MNPARNESVHRPAPPAPGRAASRARRRWLWLLALLLLALLLAGCRNETQNRIRRSIQDFTNTRLYITVYSYDGKAIFEGVVDGKVTRSSDQLSNTNERASGDYIYWYDERGRYHQTDLPYLLTIYDRNALDGAETP